MRYNGIEGRSVRNLEICFMYFFEWPCSALIFNKLCSFEIALLHLGYGNEPLEDVTNHSIYDHENCTMQLLDIAMPQHFTGLWYLHYKSILKIAYLCLKDFKFINAGPLKHRLIIICHYYLHENNLPLHVRLCNMIKAFVKNQAF